MLLLKGGTVLTMGSAGILPEGEILISDGKILQVGYDLFVPADCQILDVKGKYVLPGLIDAHSHIGGNNLASGKDDLNELANPMNPELDACDGIDPWDPLYEDIMKDGITASCVIPGSGNVIGGWGVVIKSCGKSLSDRLLKRPAVLKAAVGLNPKSIYAAKSMAPMTRMSVYQMLHSYFARVLDYQEKKEHALAADAPFVEDTGLEHGIPVLKKEIPLKVHCYQHDMMTVLDLAKEYDFMITLDHAQGASDFLSELTDEHVKGVIYGPVVMGLGPGETCKADYEALHLLDEQGILTAMNTDGPVVTGETLIYQVGEAVRAGMEPVKALSMVTVNAAKILDVDGRIGSLEASKDADIVVFSGFPGRDVTASVEITIIDGSIVYRKE